MKKGPPPADAGISARALAESIMHPSTNDKCQGAVPRRLDYYRLGPEFMDMRCGLSHGHHCRGHWRGQCSEPLGHMLPPYGIPHL